MEVEQAPAASWSAPPCGACDRGWPQAHPAKDSDDETDGDYSIFQKILDDKGGMEQEDEEDEDGAPRSSTGASSSAATWGFGGFWDTSDMGLLAKAVATDPVDPSYCGQKRAVGQAKEVLQTPNAKKRRLSAKTSPQPKPATASAAKGDKKKAPKTQKACVLILLLFSLLSPCARA